MESFVRSLRRTQLNRFRMNRAKVLDKAVQRLVNRRVGGRLPMLGLTDAVYGWGNEGWSADEDYLARLMYEAEATGGSIVECGSGLSTLLLATVAEHTGVQVHSLEHNPDWRQRVVDALAAHGLTRSVVHHAPLKNYGEFDWYTVPASLPNDVSLVVCDGPPADTLGGRYGVLPALRSHFAQTCTILLDDAIRAPEIEILSRWELEFGAVSERHETHKGFARVAVTSE